MSICTRVQNNAPNNPYKIKVRSTGNVAVDGKLFKNGALIKTWSHADLGSPKTVSVNAATVYSIKIRAVFTDQETPQDEVVATLTGGIEKTCVLTREGPKTAHFILKTAGG